MPPNPKVHHRHTLPRVFHSTLPPLVNKPADPLLQLSTRKQSLRLIRAHDARAHGSAHNSACMGEEKQVGRLAQRNCKYASNQAPERCIVRIGVRRGAERGREGCQRIHGRLSPFCPIQSAVRALVARLEAAIPHSEECASLGYAGSPRDCARCASIEVVIERLDFLGCAVAGEHVWERGASEGRQRQTEEGIEEWKL